MPAPFHTRRRTTHRLRTLLVAMLLASAVAIACWLADAMRDPAGAVRITAGHWQTMEVPSAQSDAPAWQHGADLPQQWQPLTLPFAPRADLLRQAGRESADSVRRVTWFLLTVPQGVTAAPLALYAGRIKTDGSIALYADGHLVYRGQQEGPAWNSTRTPLWVVFDHDRARPKELLIRLEHSPRSKVAVTSVWLGSAAALSPRHAARNWLQLQLPAMLGAAFLAVGLFAMCVWCRRSSEKAYLMFFFLGVASYFRGLHFYIDRLVANDWFAWLTINSLFWLVMASHIALRQLHGHALPWPTRIMYLLTAATAIVTLPVAGLLPLTPLVTPLIYPLAALMGVVVCVLGVRRCWRRSVEGMLVAVGVGLCVLLGLSDWLLQNHFVDPEGWYLGAYTNAVTFATFGVLLFRRYVGAVEAAEQLSASLAVRLREREAELQASHQRLREIELRQTISDERQRLMQDMHDGLGSSLISAIRSVERGGLSDTRLSQLLRDCLDDLKLTIDSMEPVEADLMLLLATLRFRLGPRLEESGVTLLWAVRDAPALPWLDPSSALHILRTLQESIANVLRHTQASQVSIGARKEEGGVCIWVEDNGGGFDVEKKMVEGGGRGLRNQQRRAQALGGRVIWQPVGGGTRFVLWLPLEKPARGAKCP